MLDREEILRNLFNKATEDTIETLPYTIQVFQDPLYDLKKTVTNDLDFLNPFLNLLSKSEPINVL